ncbi:unnamed protein product [Clonostachys chloroleuca]|uniref:Rhodopsin domain-containing protein n=1 Tax=Clonostachys chloroleuca TaxID=1926264 RepID=A0AA35VMJ7_9HYPO|nr:unnamed protein product [Clonostachys chloroleuca]
MKDDDVLTIVGAIGAILGIIVVAIRFYARHMTNNKIGWDDWCILISTIAVIGGDVLVVVANSMYPNSAEVASHKDPSYEYTEDDIHYTKLSFGATSIYFTTVSATKLSILLMYNRIFSISHSFRRQILLLTLLTAAFWMATTISNCLNCIPLEYVWINAKADPRYCINYNLYWMGCGLAECAIDILILLVPVRTISSLKLSRSKKIAVAGVFMLGTFVIISGIVKVVLSYVPGSRQPNFGQTSLWSSIHISTGIIGACLPVCWPVFIRLEGFLSGKTPPASSVRGQWYGSSRGSTRFTSKTTRPQEYPAHDFHDPLTGQSDVHELLQHKENVRRSVPSISNNTNPESDT